MTPARHMLVVLGTRPEAVKLAPLILAAREVPGLRVTTCATAQHRELLDGVLETFGVVPDIDLDLMLPDQDLGSLTARVLGRMREVLSVHQPDLVVVQGDTTSAMATALAAHFAGVPVAHIEAGLRTSSIAQPWPEEANRRVISRLASCHFSPTVHAAANLVREGVDPTTIHTVGNTGIDAAAMTTPRSAGLPPGTVLVTCHRRENHRDEFLAATDMIRALADAFPHRSFVLPVHPSPRVREPLRRALSQLANLHIREPLDYPAMLGAIADAHVVLTDSGGVQEEAAWFGTPCLVARPETDRPESVDTGQAFVVGLDPAAAIDTLAALDDDLTYARAAVPTTAFGDGTASTQIIQILAAQ